MSLDFCLLHFVLYLVTNTNSNQSHQVMSLLCQGDNGCFNMVQISDLELCTFTVLFANSNSLLKSKTALCFTRNGVNDIIHYYYLLLFVHK